MQQHGVGIKVANCVALFAYGRMECAPVDVWIQRVIDQHYAGQNPFPAYGNAGILQQWMFYFAVPKRNGSNRKNNEKRIKNNAGGPQCCTRLRNISALYLTEL